MVNVCGKKLKMPKKRKHETGIFNIEMQAWKMQD